MKVLILSKRHFDITMLEEGVNDYNIEQKKNVFLISINDTLGTNEMPYFNKNHSNVLNLFFDDVEKDIDCGKEGWAKAFTIEQARTLYVYIRANKDKKTCIVHCSAGISRSGAVGTFINDFFRGNYAEFKQLNKHILPNGLVLALLNQIARETEQN